jgi:hypothetical protein
MLCPNFRWSCLISPRHDHMSFRILIVNFIQIVWTISCNVNEFSFVIFHIFNKLLFKYECVAFDPHLKFCVIVLVPFDPTYESNYVYPKKGFSKCHIEVYSAWLDDLLQFHQVNWNFSYRDKFYSKRENSPDFLCMNEMHTSVFSFFVTSKPGMLHVLPILHQPTSSVGITLLDNSF